MTQASVEDAGAQKPPAQFLAFENYPPFAFRGTADQDGFVLAMFFALRERISAILALTDSVYVTVAICAHLFVRPRKRF